MIMQYFRHILTLCSLALISNNLLSQKLTYSEPDRDEARQINFEIIGQYNNQYLIYKNYRSINYISVYNQEMKQVAKNDLTFMPEKTIEASFVAYPDYAFMFYQFQKKGVVSLMAVKLDANGKNLTEPITIDTTIIGNFSDEKIYSVIASEDKSHIMAFRINTKNERRYQFKTLLFDKELNLKHSTQQLGLSMNDRNDFLTDFDVDNNGNMVFGRGIRVGSNDNITKFFLLLKAANADSFHTRELVLNNYSLDEVKLKIDNYNNRYLFTGFYYPGRKTVIEGVANAIFDKAADNWVVQNTVPFDAQLREDNRGPNTAKNAFNDFYIHDITIRSDGAFLMNAECNYSTNRGNTNPYNRWSMMNPWMSPMDYYRWGGFGMGSPWGWGSPWGFGNNNITRNHSENIIILAFDKNGKMLLTNQVVKSQFDDDGSNEISYQRINTGAGLHYLYNDQEARNTVLAYQTLTPEGRVIRNPTIKSQTRDYKFMPRFSKQVDRKVVIIPTLYRNSLCFARLEFLK